MSTSLTPDPATNSSGNSKPFQVDYAELEKFAQQHDLNAEEVQKWAAMDQDFPEEYLRTHGKVNYGTYLKIKEFMASKLAAGTGYAERQMQTAEKVRNVVATVSNIDSGSATDVRAMATPLRATASQFDAMTDQNVRNPTITTDNNAAQMLGAGGDDVVDDDNLLNDFADRLIMGGAWTWADEGLGK